MDTPHSLAFHLSVIPDPRSDHALRHKLIDILVIAICAMLCGAESFVEMAEFGRCKERWLRERLELPGGIPSHDTFNRVFAQIDPEQFHLCFVRWVEALQKYLREQREHGGNGEIGQGAVDQLIAIDGKTLRRSFNRAQGTKGLHLVSAWSAVTSLTLGQVRVEDKSNEITAIPALLEFLDINGCVVTIDAMGTQKEIARQIISKGGDYVLPVKDNHPTMRQAIERFFVEGEKAGFKDQPHEVEQVVEKDHGRIETRKSYLVALNTTVISACPKDTPKLMKWLDPEDEWAGLQAIGMIVRQREIRGVVSQERQYYITSLSTGVERFSRAARGHWGIENELHWSLDVSFNEDQCRVRAGYATENLALLRKIALNLIKQETTRKIGIKAKRRRAGWDESYLELVLAGPKI